MSFYIHQLVELRKYIIIISLFIFCSYVIYFICDAHTIYFLGKEDSLFESLTSLFFLASSILFFRTFVHRKNVFLLLLSLMFFIGSGEEISWGQRILGFETPAFLEKINVQGEFNVHNIAIANNEDSSEAKKTGLGKLLTVNFQYKLFWLTYGILLPLAYWRSKRISALADRIRLPVPPLVIGVFFMINWLVFRVTLSFLLPPNMNERYYWTIGEVSECVSAFVFMVIGFYFLQAHKFPARTFTGKQA